jgi:ComF family protein
LDRKEEKQRESALCSLCRWQDYQNPQAEGPEGRCALLYEERLREAIRQLKYEGKKAYGAYFARWMLEEGGSWAAEQGFDRMTAVPLARSRMRLRGYNQAEVIARELSRLCRVPYEELLERRRETEAQSALGAAMRGHNMEGVFAVRPGSRTPRHICLVDDIYTTGSTVRACREALEQAWPEVRVTYWVLAGRISSNFSDSA